MTDSPTDRPSNQPTKHSLHEKQRLLRMRPINVWAPHFYTFDFKVVDIVPCSIWFARIVRVFSLKKLLFLRKKKYIEAIVFFDLFCLSTHASWLLIGRTRTLSWNRAIFICLSYACFIELYRSFSLNECTVYNSRE